MTAHPKIDPVTGEMLFFGYDIFGPPYLRFHVVDRHGRLVLSKEITIPRATMMHDFAVTERHVVFLDLPVVYDLSLLGRRPIPAQWKPEYGARVGVMPRDASTAPRWFEVEPSYVFHTVNAYDDGETVVLDVVRHAQMFTDDLYGSSDGTGTLDRWTIDLGAGRVREQRIDDRTQEFPRVDERILGRRHRYAYTTRARLGDFVEPFGTLLQHDLKSGTTTAAKLGPGRQAGEGIFVPASTTASEDEGWVLAVVYNALEDRSDLVILDTTNFGGEPVATVALPAARSLRIPRHLGTGSPVGQSGSTFSFGHRGNATRGHDMKRRNCRNRRFTEQLRSTSLFCDCSKDELRLAASLMTELTLPAGCVVIRQGAAGYECFILLSGQAVVERDGVIVGHAVAGSIVGELALMGDVSHGTTVTAATDLDALVMSRTEFAAMRALGTRGIGPRIDAAAAEHRDALERVNRNWPLADGLLGECSSRW